MSALILGILGTAIAAIGLAVTGLEFRARRRAIADEQRVRGEQIALLRRQVETAERQAERDEAAQEAARSADVRVARGGRSGLSWAFELVNAGPATATAVKAWLINAEDGRPVSVTCELAAPLLAGQSTEGRNLEIPCEGVIRESPRMPLAVMVAWTDMRERERRDEFRVDL